MNRVWIPDTNTRWLLVAAAILAFLGCLWLGWTVPHQTLLSYLAAFIFFLDLTLGSLAILLIHSVTGGQWCIVLRPALLAAARVLPLLAVLVVPILINTHDLYPWANRALLATDPVLRKQTWYLNAPFFIVRNVGYFTLWCSLLFALSRRLQTDADNPSVCRPLFGALALMGWAFSMIFASVDWTMSLTPHWHSSSWGMAAATGQMLVASALAVWLSASRRNIPVRVLHDLGNLLLMFILFWSYLAFMEYLTVWIADLPNETIWYIPRTLTSWRYAAWFLIAFHFAVPFAVLLSRKLKRRGIWLTSIAGLLVIAHGVDVLWIVLPAFRPHGLSLRWSDPLAFIGVGCLWLAVFLGQWTNARPVHTAREAAYV